MNISQEKDQIATSFGVAVRGKEGGVSKEIMDPNPGSGLAPKTGVMNSQNMGMPEKEEKMNTASMVVSVQEREKEKDQENLYFTPGPGLALQELHCMVINCFTLFYCT